MADTAEEADTTETVLITSVLSTFRFFVVLAVGYLASIRPAREPGQPAEHPKYWRLDKEHSAIAASITPLLIFLLLNPALLTREVCRNVSRVAMDLFLPCLLLASIGGNLNPVALRDSWHLFVGSALTIALSNAMAWAFGWLLLSPESRPTFRPVQMAIAFPNSLVFPLVLLDALCEQATINSDFDGDSDECYDQATGMIFVFTACWQIIFFGWGIYCLKEGDALELSLAIQPAIATAATAANNLAEETAIPAGPIHQPLAAAGLSPYEKDSCNDGGSDGSNDGRPESSPSSATFNPLYIHTFFRKPATKTSGGYGSRVAGSSGGGAAAAGREDDRSGSEARTTAAVAAVYSPPDPPRYSGVVRAIEARAIEIMGEEPQADGDGDVSVNMPPAVNGAPPLQHHQTETAASPGRSSGFFSAAESLELEEGGVGGGETGGFVCHDGGDDDSDGGSSETLWERVKQRAWNVVASPVIIALGAGIVVCLIEPLQDMLFHNPQAFLRPLGGAIQAVGVPMVTVSTLVMAASLVPVAAPPPSALSSGEEGEHATPIWRRPGFIMGALLIVLRLVAVPAVLFGLFWLAKSTSSVMGENRLMHLILLVEFGMPSAALLVPVLNQIRMPNTASLLTRLFVWQSAASSITVSFWTALAINMLY